MQDLLPEFIAETRDTLQAVAGSLVAWEASPDDRALLDEIFRFVHTVKGSCGFLNLPRLQRLSHAAEDALASLRSGARSPGPALVTAILRVIDRIAELTEALDAGDPVPDGDEAHLIAAVSAEPLVGAESAPERMPRVRATGPRASSRTVRLPLDLLDRMMAAVSETVLARNELFHAFDGNMPTADGAFERLSHRVSELRDAVTRARMARIETLFGALPRLVRDLGLALGKQVSLEIEGGEVELDREMIETVRDPLLHAVRNAIDHGLELPDVRIARGKPARGSITVTARKSGSRILMEIADDGAGIDTDRLTACAVEAGLITSQEAAGLDHARAVQLVFAPGLTTAPHLTAISGRGVGMDVVRANVERLGGNVSVVSSKGIGTCLTFEVPLTLSIIPAIIVGSGDQRFGIARPSVQELVKVGSEVRTEWLGGGLMADIRGRRMPVVDLRRVLSPDHRPAPLALLVVLQTPEKGQYALAVDAVHDHQELVVKPAAPAVMSTGLFAGTTLPDNSDPMLLLDVTGLAAAAGIMPAAPGEAEPVLVAPPTSPALLVRDLDGAERVVRLSDVDRIEDVDRARIFDFGGRQLLAAGDKLVPLHARGPLPDCVRVLNIAGQGSGLAYAVRDVIDIAPVSLELFPASDAGPIAGVVLHDGRPIEQIDAQWLLSAGRSLVQTQVVRGGPSSVPMHAAAA